MYASFLTYLQSEKRYSPHTLKAYEGDLAHFQAFLKATFEIEDPAGVTYQMVRNWVVTLMEAGLEPKSINRKLASVRSLFKYLRRQGQIIKDPMTQVRAPKVKKALPVFVEEDNLRHLFEQIPFSEDFEGLRDRLIMELLYGTGMRLAECLGLTALAWSKHEKTLKVRGKGNKERLIPIHHELEMLLEKYLQAKESQFSGNLKDVLIVTNDGEPGYPMLVYRVVRKYLDLVTGVEKRSPHVLRHSFATHLLNKGADLNAIKDLLGHASLAATQVYTHNSMEKLKAIFDQAHPKA
jgi:integrase/recombinase XerC